MKKINQEFVPKKLLGCYINPGPASTNTPNIISGGSSPDGTKIGNNSQSPVSFFGVSPAAPQSANANQAAISSNAANGMLISMTVSTVVPNNGTISASTCSPVAVTFASTGMISAVDLPIINK